jgi:hypothetical protein
LSEELNIIQRSSPICFYSLILISFIWCKGVLGATEHIATQKLQDDVASKDTSAKARYEKMELNKYKVKFVRERDATTGVTSTVLKYEHNDQLVDFKENRLIYVADSARNFYFASSPEAVTHHSDFFKGGAVSGAGEAYVVDGKIKYLNNKSGHYRPNAKLFQQTLKLLTKSGVNTDELEARLFDGNVHALFGEMSVEIKL